VLAADPTHPDRIFLGTADGHIFGSVDSGEHWSLLGRASARFDAVITAIVVDPRDSNVLFASSWTRDDVAGGGVFRSADGGQTWSNAGLAGQAVRVLVMAPSDPDILVAGTLDGVFRSLDASKSWQRISPEHHAELRNFDALAIDPRDSQIVYAGTFHLPWKTTDGGRTWNPIHEGMIDDSDVMSILIDSADSRRVYASACSGIYRSDDSAAQWRKIQGIPYTARRTYAITQDSAQPEKVYAATSEGLWKTANGGMTWSRTTPASWVVNAVVTAGGHSNRVLIGTEKFGVLSSEDGGEHFQDANAGFNHRQILALTPDPNHAGRLLAVLPHALEPILLTEDDGETWSAPGPGLRADQPLRVYVAPDDTWWASLSGGGLMRFDSATKRWIQAGTISRGPAGVRAGRSRRSGGVDAGGQNDVPTTVRRHAGAARSSVKTQAFMDIVAEMAFSSKEWYAATNRGLLVSRDSGATWTRRPVGGLVTVSVQSVRVTANGLRIRIASQRGLIFSDDGGKSWTWHDPPPNSAGVLVLDTNPNDENTLIAMCSDGLYISRDAGRTWHHAASGLPSTAVQDFSANGSRFVTAMRTGGLYVSADSGDTWDRLHGAAGDTIFAAVSLSNTRGQVIAASATDGIYRVELPDSAARGANVVE
jgi:photosystem II stability/assembly factor-like uncharacterized protein